ncbi:MAG: FkbM family methyltransferase [Anaerolineae bacterium]
MSQLIKIPGIQLLVKFLHRIVPDRYLQVLIVRGSLSKRHLMLNLRYQMGYWIGLTEPDLQATFKSLIKAGDTVYDVGAEIGYFTILSAILAQTGRVYAFEPNPSNLVILSQNVALNKDLQITVIPKAVGDREQQVEFLTYAHRTDITNASLLGRLAQMEPNSARGRPVAVNMIDLDTFSRSNNSIPNVIKIDVEGAETLVLAGMKTLLLQFRPRLIIEVHNPEAEKGVQAHLKENNYTMQTIGRTFETTYPFRILCLPN